MYRLVVLPDLLGGGDAVLGRHEDVQQQDVVAGPALDGGQQVQRAAEGSAFQVGLALGAVFFQQSRQLVVNVRVIVTEREPGHRASTSFAARLRPAPPGHRPHRMIEKVYHFLCGLTSAFAAFFPKVQRGKKSGTPLSVSRVPLLRRGFNRTSAPGSHPVPGPPASGPPG